MATRRTTRRRTRVAGKKLTDKQQQVISLADEGLTITEAAERMGITRSGIYGHVRKLAASGHMVTFKTQEERVAARANGEAPGRTSDVLAVTDATRLTTPRADHENGWREREVPEIVGAYDAVASTLKKAIETQQRYVAVLDEEIAKYEAELADARARQEQARLQLEDYRVAAGHVGAVEPGPVPAAA